MPSVPDRWVRLRVRFEGPFVVVRLRDDTGAQIRAHWEGPFMLPAPEAARLADHVRAIALSLPATRPGPHSTGPVPLPLFVDLPPFVQDDRARADAFLGSLLALLDPDRIQLVIVPGGSPRLRPPFTIPFRVAAHGAGAAAGLSAIEQSPWMSAPDVRRRAFSVDMRAQDATTSLEQVLREAPQDVLVTDYLGDALAVVRTLPLERRPRLILAVGVDAAYGPGPRLPNGVALAIVGGFTDAVREVLYGLVHDLPVHETMKAAIRTVSGLASVARLYADPVSNQALRMRDALIALQNETEALAFTLPSTTVTEFLARTDLDFAEFVSRPRIGPLRDPRLTVIDEASRIDRGMKELIAIRKETAALQALPEKFEEFQQEDEGLVPMASTAEQLELMANVAQDGKTAVGSALSPAIEAALEAHQIRVVDIAVQRLDTSPLLSPVDTRTTLEAGAVYRLRVHIGNPAADSVVTGPQPPIDPLLPEPTAAGHLLDVIVQGKTFDVIGQRTQTVHLPRFGGSTPVYFGVRTPRQLGSASLRVHVYYRNHLVHSYELDAEITPTETRSVEEVLRATLAYARLERLAHFDEVGARALSIGFNSNGDTHSVVVKGTGAAGELALPGGTYDQQVKDFHASLTRAAVNRNGNVRTYPTVTPGTLAPPDAADVLRDLIQQGATLYRSMKKRAIISSPTIATAFDRIKSGQDEKIQVVRLQPTDVFPWRLIYDFELPPALPNAAVCLGTRIGATGIPEPCGHAYDSKAYCVRGFWSVRHYLEELIKRAHELKGPVTKPAQNGVRLVCDTSLSGVTTLQQDVTAAIGASHVASGPTVETTLLDLLWKAPPERPAILVVLGHMDLTLKPGTLDSYGITLQSGEWLTQAHVDDKLSPTPWQQPQPVVLLMACEAAAMTATTANEFVSSFHAAGAGAIVGSEAMIDPEFAAGFASDITRALWAGGTLGEALAHYRRRTLETGNPLAFLFHAIGDVDLTIQ